MKQLLSSHAEIRSLHQRNELILIARSRSEFIIIMLIGNEKSLFFIVPSQLPKTQISIVIVSLVALKHDFQQRCKKLNIFYAVYDPVFLFYQLYALSTLLLMNIELVVENSFVFFVASLHAMSRLNRLFLNKAHLLLTARYYRRNIDVINQLRRVSCLFVCITAILLSFVEHELKSIMHFTQFESLRASGDRPNLCYFVQSVPSVNAAVFEEKLLLNETTKICMQDMQF